MENKLYVSPSPHIHGGDFSPGNGPGWNRPEDQEPQDGVRQ